MNYTKHTFDVTINIMFFDPQNVTPNFMLRI
jgi:hypothetical protein